MKQLCLILMFAVGAGCATKTDGPPKEGTIDPGAGGLGTLAFDLTASDGKGRQYRLRNAEFRVQGYWGYSDGGIFSTVLSTETDPAAPVISVRLVPGSYNLSLGGNWYIERLTANGPERVEKVALLSEPYQYIYISHNWTTHAAFRFGVDGDLIDFRHGDLNISIEIEEPGDQADGGAPRGDAGSVHVDASPGF